MPFWWNNTGKDWVLDDSCPPVLVSPQAYTGSGSASDGTMWMKWLLNRVSGTASETGLCSLVVTTDKDVTAQVGCEFNNMTASATNGYVIPDGWGVNLDYDEGAGAVNLTISAYTMVEAYFLRGEGATQS